MNINYQNVCTDKTSQPPEPYNGSSIVKLLENTGIGRYTYASLFQHYIIEIIL